MVVPLVQAAVAQTSALDKILGPHVLCSGTTEWHSAGDGTSARSESWRLAVSKSDPRIVLFPDGAEPLAEDVWPCSAGFCTSTRVLETAVSSSAVRLTAEGADYRLAVVFSVVSPDGAGLQSSHVLGNGTMSCDDALPASVLAHASQ